MRTKEILIQVDYTVLFLRCTMLFGEILKQDSTKCIFVCKYLNPYIRCMYATQSIYRIQFIKVENTYYLLSHSIF